MLRSVLSGFGHYLPERILTNAELEKTLDTSDAWIRERTGITQRHIAADNESTAVLSAKAAQQALNNAGVKAEDIDAVLVATTTPNDTFPATATRVQAALGMQTGFAFDLQAACSGFIYALTLADSLIRGGNIRRALVIGAETYSRIVDWQDRNTCILFGDGAGAVVLSAEENSTRGVLHSTLSSDGKLADILKTDGGVSTTQQAGTIQMEGREVFRHAVSKMAGAVKESLTACDLTVEDVDWLVPHQANKRILQSVAQRLHFPESKVVCTLDRHANTSAASIPLALSVANQEGKLKTGNILS